MSKYGKMRLAKYIYTLLAVAAIALTWATSESAMGCGVWGESVYAEESGTDDNTTIGEIKRYGGDTDAAFIASGRTGEAAFMSSSIATTPAQVLAQRRTVSCERNSLERTLAEHFGSTVTACRFGLLDFKHIIHSNHSFLLLIAVLVI